MTTPAVVRPAPADLNQNENKSSFTTVYAARWAKWVILGSLGVGIAALIVVAIVSWKQRARTENARREWDQVFLALKNKNKPEEQIAALEAITEKVVGTPSHAYVLMYLGDLYFAEAIKPEKMPEERAAALKKAVELFKLVATQNPFRDNLTFGPLALQNTALAYEQGGEYDEAIRFLEEGLARPDLENTSFLYNKLIAQLGRLYYLRSLKKIEAGQDAKPDIDNARKRLTDVLRVIGRKDNPELGHQQDSEFIREIEYIKSLVDKPGKLLPDGIPPPPKPIAAEQKADVSLEHKDAPKVDEIKKIELKKEEPKNVK
ncbi:MAG: hypothetical protein V1899_09295 [Planctomycetota bacterium]